ncbi:MAG: hypothetical protein M0T71_09705 [Actinomycetota bacterium]|nr:hypothetical protein [Actinomycetota bacterium]
MSLPEAAERNEGTEARLAGRSTLGRVVPLAPGTGRTRLPAVAALSAGGLVVQAVGDAIARSGHGALGLDLFFVGVACAFASAAWRLLGRPASRDERLGVALVLGLVLVVSSWMASPLLFDQYDELLHETTLWQLLDTRHLFGFNSVLPISPWYPGLELVTVTLRWVTGLPSAAVELLVVLACRALLVVALFRFGERVLGSARAAGVVVLVYALSPQFYAFNAAYSYQTIALAFGAAAVELTLSAADAAGTRRRRLLLGLAMAAVGGAVLSHHLTGWLTVGLLVVWAVAATLDARRDAAGAARAAAVRLVAAAGVLLAAAWTAVTAPRLIPYLSPVFSGAVSSLAGLLNHGGHRALFHSATGVATPRWQEALIVLSVLVTLALVAGGIVRFVRRRHAPARLERLVAVVVSIGYLAVLASPLEGAASQVGQRGSTFVYLAIALLAATLVLHALRRVPLPVLVALATATFLGSLVFGSGASWSYVPGPYVPASDQRAIDGPTIAAARWAASHLPVGARVAADRDSSITMAAVGHLSPVTEAAGEVNVGLFYFARTFGNFERAMIRRFDIRYLVVDRRLASGPPYFGVYFEPGVPAPGARNRLTAGELAKFAHVAGLQRIYSNGPIQIYDAAGILGTRARAAARPPIGRPGTEVRWAVLWPFLAVAAEWLAVLVRRRRRHRRVAGASSTAVLTGTLVAALVVALAYVPTGLPVDPLAWSLLGVAGVGGLVLDGRARRAATAGVQAGEARERAGAGGAPAGAGRAGAVLALVAGLGVAAAVLVAVRSDQHAFRVENALSITPVGTGRATVEVSLAAGTRAGATLVAARGRTTVRLPLAPRAEQRRALPPSVSGTGGTVRLVVGGRTVASVQG